MRMKRVFGKIDTRQHGTISLSATDETARDLQWFMDRFPLQLEGEAQEQIEKRSASHKERMATVAQVLGVKKQQIVGIRHDADGALFEQMQNDGNRIKDLARDFLDRSKQKVEVVSNGE
jgi:hypothetical protein